MKTLRTLFIVLSMALVGNFAFAQCTYSVYMHDSYGDGWNGAFLQVAVGTTIDTINFTDSDGNPAGDDYTVTFSVNTGDPLSVAFNAGSYDTEIYYEIRDANGSVIFSDGVFTGCCFNTPSVGSPAPTAGTVYTGVAACPTCNPSTNLIATNISAGTALIDWTTVNTMPMGYIIEYGPAGFAQGSGTTVTSMADSVFLTGLMVDSTYEVYVQDVCSAIDTSGWAGPLSFLHVSCSTSVNLTASNMGLGSALVNWTSNNPGASYSIEYGPTGFAQGTGTVVTSNVDSAIISGLMIDSTYDVYVIEICSPTDSSHWTGPVTFFHGYCQGGPVTTDDSNVESVILAGNGSCLINYQGCQGPNGDGGFSGVQNAAGIVVLSPDSTYSMTVTLGSCGGYYNGAGTVWIDFNGDLNFDPSEVIFADLATNAGPATYTVTFTVPSNAAIGTTTMRAMQWEGGSLPLNPCGSFNWGSVTDFNITIGQGSAGCPNCVASVNLNAENVSAGTIELDWDSFNDTSATFIVEYGAVGFTPGTGAGTVVTSSVDSAFISGLMVGSTYDFYVMDVCSANDSSGWVGPLTFTHGACSGGGPSSTADSNIEGLQLAGNAGCGINYVGCTAGGITGVEQSTETTSLSPDSTYSMTVTLGSCGGYYNGAGTVWIDFNGDLNFDPSEVIFADLATNAGPATYTVTFTVPSNAAIGTTTMRAMQWEGGSLPLNPCGSFTWGSVTDFSINIGAPQTSICIYTAPYTHSFETAGILDTCWAQDTADVFDWTLQTGSTVSGNTGPAAAYSGNYYAYIETSSPVLSGDDAVLVMPSIDVSNLGSPALEFYFHMYGADMGILRVEAKDCGTPWTTIWEKSGDQGDAWRLAQVDLSAFASLVDIRFVGIDSVGFTGDAAIDDVAVKDISCFVPTYVSVDTAGFNFAQISWDNSIQNVIIEYGPAGFTPGSGAGTVANGGANPFSVTGLMDGTEYDFYLYQDCGGAVSTPSLVATGATLCSPQPLDYTEGFEGTGLDICWAQSNADIFDWTINSGSTGSPGTGPDAANTGSNYMYIETSTPRAPQDSAILVSSPIDLTGAIAEMSFFYHMFGSGSPSMGTLRVDVESPAYSGNWMPVFSHSGDQQSATSDPFEEATVSLASYTGQSVRARFVGTIGVIDSNLNNNQVWRSDIAIDDVSFLDACASLMVSDSMTNIGEVGITVMGGMMPYSYSWNTGDTSATITGVAAGTYTVTITDAQGCSIVESYDVQYGTNTTNIAGLTSLSIAPNPANQTANVNLSFSNTAKNVEVALFNAVGQMVITEQQSNVADAYFAFDVSDLAAGVYIVRINVDGEQTAQRLIISH